MIDNITKSTTLTTTQSASVTCTCSCTCTCTCSCTCSPTMVDYLVVAPMNAQANHDGTLYAYWKAYQGN